MLFSISESNWWLIAVAATAFFTIVTPETVAPAKLVDELGAAGEPYRRRRRVFYVASPVGCAAILALNLLRPESTSALLFMYSVAVVALPLALFPVRERIFQLGIAHQHPDTKVKPDRPMMAWIYVSITGMMVVATLALMTTR
ncbi:hypothetical protein [Streptomyces sp. NPDC048252]|uniref:hypothetical protein n=1 Tax=Streptomyces sp. NPDC048252 TaxID=3154612 RepID=UPI00342FC904